MFRKLDEKRVKQFMNYSEKEMYEYLANTDRKELKSCMKEIYKAMRAKKWSINYLKEWAINESFMSHGNISDI